MKPHALIAMILLMLAVCAHAGREPCITGDVCPGVSASFKHKIVIEEETWPSALAETHAGREVLRLEAAGGFRLHVRVRTNPDDYIICVIYVDEGERLVLDESTSFVFRYGGHEIESTEILLTDSPQEMKVFSTSEQTVVLTADSSRYSKTESGGYLAAVRFPENSLPAGHGSWVPDSFDLRGGGYREESSG
ncbi:MAG: hypothetical protein KAW67_04360 [Candidatus Eisenbacteria sp.]|nr:hypothetical protein [Candidatus Eisenbacteria bacterium]